MNETKPVKVQLTDGTIKECSIDIMSSSPAKLLFSGLRLPKRDFLGDDLFEAVIALRLELETIGAQLLCIGSRRDAFPSGMSRDMGGGRKVSIACLGNPMNEKLFDIFDYAEPELVSSVADQNEFHEKWIASLKSRR